ncbi:MAG: hypothetical protein ACRD0J_16315 [Acidimicrobiales bacterium]
MENRGVEVVLVHGRPDPELRAVLRACGYRLAGLAGATTAWVPLAEVAVGGRAAGRWAP